MGSFANLILSIFILTAAFQAKADDFNIPFHFDAKSAFRNSYTDDARAEVTNSALPWSAIGRLDNPDDTWCTATLIARNFILTAAHCVMDSKTQQFRQGDYVFSPNFTKGSSKVSSGITHAWWGTTWPQNDRGNDWAILQLAKPLGDSNGWLDVQNIAPADLLKSKEGFYLAGYSSDFLNGESASWEKGCAFKEFNSTTNWLLHNCDMSNGASGAPIFYTDSSGHSYVVAINVADFRGDSDTSLVHVPYTHETANIAVPTSTFLSTLQYILK